MTSLFMVLSLRDLENNVRRMEYGFCNMTLYILDWKIAYFIFRFELDIIKE